MLHLCVAIPRVLEKNHTQQKLNDKQHKKNDEKDDNHSDGGDDVVRGPYVPRAGVERVVKRIAVGCTAEGVANEGVEAVEGGDHGGRRGRRGGFREGSLRRYGEGHGDVGGEEHVVCLDGGADEKAGEGDDGEAETPGEGWSCKGLGEKR